MPQPRHKTKEQGYYQILLNQSESYRFQYPRTQADLNWKGDVIEKAAVLVAGNWRHSKCEILGYNEYGPTILYTFKYRD